jgi:hypothetical protein
MSDLESENRSRQNNKGIFLIIVVLLLFVAGIVGWWLISQDSSAVSSEAYHEMFDSIGTWTSGEDVGAVGNVVNGVYELSVEESGSIFWVTAGRTFKDGQYSVEATPLQGAVDNGYGMLFRADSEDNSFYIFKVSSDGFVFIGRCLDSCLDQQVIVDQDWFSSAAVRQGFNVTNTLRAVASGQDMIFYINDLEVGRATNDELRIGDIGLVAETFTPGGLRVAFDNFLVTPLE